MTNFKKEFHTKGTEIRMSDAERSRVHAALRAKMHEQPVASPFFIASPFVLRFAAALVVVLVVGSTGTAFAAENALPGDTLYPVKVSVVEPVEGAFQISPSAKAEWNAKIATKRLAEAEKLAAEGRLTPAASSELAANFTAHATAVTAATNDISATDPETASDISASFSSAVAAHGAAILAAGNKNSVQTSGSLVVAIAADEDTDTTEAAPVTRTAVALKAPTNTGADASALSMKAHSALAHATSSLATLNLPKSTLASAKAHAALIQNRIVKADAELAIGSTSEAVDDYNRALRDIATLTEAANVTSGNPVPDVHDLLTPIENH